MTFSFKSLRRLTPGECFGWSIWRLCLLMEEGREALVQLFETHLGDLVQALEEADFVELTGDYLVVHERGRS